MNHIMSLIVLFLLFERALSIAPVCHFMPTIVPVANISSNATTFQGMAVVTNGTSGPCIEINFTVAMYDTNSDPDKVNITLSMTNFESYDITFASLEINLNDEMDAYWDSGIPGDALKTGRSSVMYNTSSIPANGTVTIFFLAEPTDRVATTMLNYMFNVYATIFFTWNNTTYGPIVLTICFLRNIIINENIIYQHGFTALTFFIMLFVGIGLAILAIWLFFYIRKKQRDASVTPSKNNDKRNRRNILMDAKMAMRSDNHTIMNISAIGPDESIVYILGMKDKLQMYREIDNLDILSSIYVDTELETEQNDAAVQASLLLICGLRHNGDIKKNVEEKATNNLQNNVKELNKKLLADFKKELENIYEQIEIKNKEKISDLRRKHNERKEDMMELVKNMSDTEKKQTVELIDKQLQTEENELTYKLALEQNEAVEKLRKKYEIKKRIGISEVQQQFIKNVIADAEMNAQKADWLLKQHKKQQEEIAAKFSDEISRQRMTLEEKLAKRRALAQATERQEDDHTEILNQIAGCQLNLIQTLKSSPSLTEEQIEDHIEKLKSDLQNVKKDMEGKRDMHTQELFKKLTQFKKKALSEKLSQQKAQLQEYINQNKATGTDDPIDPISYVTGFIKLKSKHRKELNDLENKMDEEHANELLMAKNKLSDDTREKLKAIEMLTIEKIRAQGVRDQDIDKIIRKHEKAVKEIEAKQIADKKAQDSKIKAELEKRKKEFAEIRAQEKQEQQDLRQYETEMLNKMLVSQFSMSEEDRERILKEHEKQLINLDSSLTLNKLRQKRFLEEKIALRRAQQMEELQQKQNSEIVKLRKIAENNGEEDDEETVKKELKMKTKHVQQQLALIQGLDFNFEKEMNEIRAEMLKERALQIKSQEERMAAFIASLQMNKAKEISRIEEQQKAINNLKANLLDDLNSRGILSTPECEQILLRHKEEQEELNAKLDKERAKQEKVLRSKLQDRLQLREEQMLKKQEEEMKFILDQATNKAAAKIRRALIVNKHLIEMEKFKNKLQREIAQTLEAKKREFNLQKQKILQEEEMKFLAGLVKVGNFEQEELLNILHLLFPLRTEDAILELLKKIYSDDKKGKKSDPKRDDYPQSTLVQRILRTQYLMMRPTKKQETSYSPSEDSFTKKENYFAKLQGNSMKQKNNFGPQDHVERTTRLLQSSPQDMYRYNLPQSQNGSINRAYQNKTFAQTNTFKSDDSDNERDYSNKYPYTKQQQSVAFKDEDSYEDDSDDGNDGKYMQSRNQNRIQERKYSDNQTSEDVMQGKKKKKKFLKTLTKQNYSSD